MAREKIRIRKIESAAARHVTFSKRRRGLFKKAQELSVLCDADVALIIFTLTGKLFEFSSSSMPEIIDRHRVLSKNLNKLQQPSQEIPSNVSRRVRRHRRHSSLENGESSGLSKEVADSSRKLRHMRGEELQGLTINELQQLENKLDEGLNRVILKKTEKITKQLYDLQQKGTELLQHKQRLIQQVAEMRQQKHVSANSETSSEEDQSSDSTADRSSSNCSDTSLKLGLP